MKSITIRNVSVSSEVDVDVDIDEVLAEIDSQTLLKYVADEIGLPGQVGSSILDNVAKDGTLSKYICDQYCRGAFSTINFKKLFDDMGIQVK